MYENDVMLCPDRYMTVNVNAANWMRTSVTKPIRAVHVAGTGHVAYGLLVTVLMTVARFFFSILSTTLLAD